MDKEHVMILLDADMRTVHARLARKFNAGIAQAAEHTVRTCEDGVSITSASPSWEELRARLLKTSDEVRPESEEQKAKMSAALKTNMEQKS